MLDYHPPEMGDETRRITPPRQGFRLERSICTDIDERNDGFVSTWEIKVVGDSTGVAYLTSDEYHLFTDQKVQGDLLAGVQALEVAVTDAVRGISDRLPASEVAMLLVIEAAMLGVGAQHMDPVKASRIRQRIRSAIADEVSAGNAHAKTSPEDRLRDRLRDYRKR